VTIRDLAHAVGVTPDTYCNRQYCTFTLPVTSTLFPTSAQKLFAHPICSVLHPHEQWNTFLMRPRHKCKDSIWMHLKQYLQLVTGLNWLRIRPHYEIFWTRPVSIKGGKFLTSWTTVNDANSGRDRSVVTIDTGNNIPPCGVFTRCPLDGARQCSSWQHPSSNWKPRDWQERLSSAIAVASWPFRSLPHLLQEAELFLRSW